MRLWVVVGVVGVACHPTHAPAPLPSEASADPSAVGAAPSATAGGTSESTPNASAASASAAIPAPTGSAGIGPDGMTASAGVAARCEELCVVTARRCDDLAALRCRGLCAKYVERSRGCESQYERALACQAQADRGELCVQVAAARCADEFGALQACERGTAVAAPATAETSLPGWERIEDPTLRFSVLLPSGATHDTTAKVWRATDGDVTYAVAAREAPRSPLSHAVMVRLVIDHVGYTCQKGLRLFGQYEANGETAIRFSLACVDDRRMEGMLRVWDDLAFFQTVEGKTSPLPAPTDFFESFRRQPSASASPAP